MMMNPESLVHLLYGAVRSTFSSIWRSGSGATAFVQTYSADGLAPFSASARDLAWHMGECIGCGSCEHARSSPRSLLDASRGLYDLHVASGLIDDLAALETDHLAKLQQDCPADIPFAEIAEAFQQLRGQSLTPGRD